MKVYRLAKEKYINDHSGKGAEIAGGRWNNKGTSVLYASDSRALCAAEIAVRTPLGILPENFILMELEIPHNIKPLELTRDQLPKNWKSYPHSNSTQQIGDNFILKGQFLVMKVPSVVVPGDFNYLMNPQHKDFAKVKIISRTPFEFDQRLFLK